MAEEQVSLAGNQIRDIHLLNTDQDVAIGNVFPNVQTCRAVFRIANASNGAGLDGNSQLLKTLLQQDTLVRR